MFSNRRRKILFMFPVVLLFSSVAISQPDTLWTGTYGKANNDVIYCTRQTTDGGFISTGYSLVQRNDLSQLNQDIWLFKTNSQGDLEWDRLFGYPGDDAGNWVEQSSDGGFIVGGVVRVAPLNALEPTLVDRLFALKTDENGELQWWYAYDNPSGPSICTCIQETFDGGYIVLGAFENDVTTDVALIKLNSVGEEEWIKTYPETYLYYDTPNFIEQTPDSGFIITGLYGHWTGDESSLFLMKTDATGEEEWTRYYGSDGFDWGSCVHHLNGNGNGYIAVGTKWHWDTGYDLWLLRTDQVGNVIWSRTFGGDDNAFGSHVELTADYYFFATGCTTMGAGGKDVYAVKVDLDGELVWQATFGGDGDDVGWCGQQLEGMDGYIIGGYTSSFSEDGQADGWLIRLASDLGIENPQPSSNLTLSASPSPFSDILNIDLFLSSQADISVRIFDTTGRLISTVFQGEVAHGTSSFQWTVPDDIPSGCYLLHLQSETLSTTRNCVLLR